MIELNENSSLIVKQWSHSQPLTGSFSLTKCVSFDRAWEMLKKQIPHLTSMVQRMRNIPMARPTNLDDDQFNALRLVALPWTPANESFISVTNDFIQENDPRDYAAWFPFLRLLEQGLAQLPSTPKKIFYRGLSDASNHSFFIGERFFWSGILACTSSLMDLRPDDQRTIFVIHCSEGKDISAFATSRSKSQILLPFDLKFQIVGCECSFNGLEMVTVKEISLVTKAEKRKQAEISRLIQRLNLQRVNSFEKFCELSLNGKQIDDALMPYLARMVLRKKQLLWLSLERNRITGEGLITLTRTLGETIPLQSFYLSQNQLTGEKSEAWMTSLFQFCPHLTFLSLKQNSIGDAGAEVLAKILKTNRILHDLWLSQSDIGNAGVRALAKALVSANRTLAQLYLDHNPLIDDTSVDCLVLMLLCNRSLDTLYLNQCSFSDKGRIEIETAVKESENFDLLM